MKKSGAALLAVAIAFPAAAAQPSDMTLALRSRRPPAERPETQSLAVPVGESRTIEIAGATAAWALDASLVDVSIVNGVLLMGRSAGRTRIVVLTPAGQSTYAVEIVARRSAIAPATRSGADHGVAEARYSSAAGEIQTGVSVTREEKGRKTEVGVRTVHYVSAPMNDRVQTSVSSATIRFFTPGRELTLLDREVDQSPLTLESTPLRGIHHLDAHWRIHAGYTAYATYRSFVIPVDRELVAGAGYAFNLTPRSTLTPSVFAYGGQGVVASLAYRYTRDDRLSLLTELGVSDGIGGAVQLAYDSDRDRVRTDVRYRPQHFAAVTTSSPRGLLADGSWTHSYGSGSAASLQFSATDIADVRAVAASIDVDHRLSDVFSLTAGASAGRFQNFSTLTVPVGARADWRHFGVGALYRYTRSDTNRGGSGGRVSMRASAGHFYASGYYDRQQNVPTLDAIFTARPDLAIALDDLGITATSPADIARALREHASLAELGFIDGVTIDLAPMRTQLGFEMAWLSGGASRQQLRLRFVRSETELVASSHTTTIATLSWARALTPTTDFFAGYSYWRTERSGEASLVDPFFEVGLRKTFDGLPSLGGGGAIAGAVFADEDLDGRSDGTPVAAEIDLDGQQTQKTGADGSFRFTSVARGSHQVVARVTGNPEAYFTTPSRVDAKPGDKVSFGVASTPARLLGRVESDAGDGIGDVRVLLTRGTRQIVATTTSDGRFNAATPPGEWQVSILTDSVPTGYSLSGVEARTVQLDRARPSETKWTLRANRSITGAGVPAGSEVELRPSGRKTRADESGRFSLRSLPPGSITIVAGSMEKGVVVPSGPASLTVDFAPAVAMATAPQPRIETIGERRDTMHWLVALGAFRVRANALDTVSRAKKEGIAATLAGSGALTLVHAGPYPTRAAAAATADRLARAGLEAVVMARK